MPDKQHLRRCGIDLCGYSSQGKLPETTPCSRAFALGESQLTEQIKTGQSCKYGLLRFSSTPETNPETNPKTPQETTQVYRHNTNYYIT